MALRETGCATPSGLGYAPWGSLAPQMVREGAALLGSEHTGWRDGLVGPTLMPSHSPWQEEEDTKPKPTKRKRKGSSAVGSDSD